jgi:hypothetical protein
MEQALHIDDTSIVLEKFTTKARNRRGNTVGIFDVLLAEILKHAAETVIPTLLLLGCLARIRCSKLDK